MKLGVVEDHKGLLGRLTERFHQDQREHLARDFFSHVEEWAGKASKEPPPNLEAHETYFEVVDAPPVVDFLNESPGSGDAAFAWQRIAGPNPMVITCIREVPAHFAVTAEDCAPTLGEGDDLHTALAEGRVFLADYKLLDGVGGGNTDGRQKYLTAPLALFAQTKTRGIRPLAIQLHQTPRDDTPLYVPDGSSYRDDALLVWDALFEFTTSYVELYYAGDGDVAGDTELAAMMEELGSPTGGRLQHIRPVTTREGLAELLANIIFIATAQHAPVNFTQFPDQGFVANMPGAARGTPPTAETPDTEAAFRARLPPIDMMLAAADAVYQLSNIRDSPLGHYGLFHWDDRHVKPLVKTLQKRLEAVEEQIVAADRHRLLTYPYLRPSQIPNSIHI